MSEYLPYLTALGGVGAFVFTVYQYVDTEKSKARNARFEQFHRVFEWVAGRTALGQTLVDTQQALAVYELGAFPEYREMSLPIIQYYIDKTRGEPDDSLFRKALLATKDKLECTG